MANAERIEEIISDEALQQVETLNNKLTVAVNNFNKALEGSKKLDAALQGAKGLREIQKQVEVLTDNQKKLSDQQKVIIQTTDELTKARTRLALADSEEAKELAKVRVEQQQVNKVQKEAAKDALGLTDQYKKLSKQHVELRREAKNIAIQYGETSKEFKEAAARANELDKKLKSIDGALGQSGREVGSYKEKIIDSFKRIGTTIAATFAAERIIAFGKEAVLAAAAAEGVKVAFNKLDSAPALMDKLKEATKGTVSELNLMKTAVRAENFKISLEALPKLLEFAQRRAQQTGESVDYLVDSIITGIGRKSPLILDNLQLSVVDINEEFKKTGDYAKAVSNIAERELTKMGPVLDTTADKIARMGAMWDDFKVSAGESMINSIDWIKKYRNEIANVLALPTLGVSLFFKQSEAEQEKEKALEEQRNFNNARIDQEKEYLNSYKQLNEAGKKDAIRQLEEEVEAAKIGYTQYYALGLTSLANYNNEVVQQKTNLIKRLNALDTSTASVNNIEKLREELSYQQSIFEKSEIGSKEQIDAKKQILSLEKQIADATGKTADEQKKKNDESTKRIKELQEREVKAVFESGQLKLKAEADLNKRIIDNDFASVDDRLEALYRYEDVSTAIVSNAAAFRLQNEKLTKTERLNIEATAAKEVQDLILNNNQIEQKILEKSYANRNDIVKKSLDERLNIIKESSAREQAALSDDESKALVVLAENYKAGVLTKEEYEKGKLEVQRKYTKARLQGELDSAQQIFESLKEKGFDSTQAEKDLADVKRKISKDLADDQIKDAERVAEEKQKLYEKEKELAGEIANTVTAFFDANIDRKKNEIQAEKDVVDVRKEADIEKVNSSLATEAEKADKLAVINARAQAQKEALERRQRQLDEQKARFDRARSIAAIIQSTAQGVMAALTSFPPNIPLSILIGAIGAAQVAQVLARPIPKYATGTDYSPEGLAIVGERGPELRINPDGTQELTPGTASYAYLKEGTKIIPADITKNLINQSMLANAGGVQFKNEADFDRHTSRMIDAYRAETKDLKKAISNRSENYVSITEGGFKTSVKKSGGWYNYINNKFSN